MGGEDVEMEVGEEEVRGVIVRFLFVVSFHSCTIPCKVPLSRRRAVSDQDTRLRIGYRPCEYGNVIESHDQTLLARASGRRRRV